MVTHDPAARLRDKLHQGITHVFDNPGKQVAWPGVVVAHRLQQRLADIAQPTHQRQPRTRVETGDSVKPAALLNQARSLQGMRTIPGDFGIQRETVESQRRSAFFGASTRCHGTNPTKT
ncbi:hypothetical protein D3C81_1925590 [compost metagenome]